MTIQIIYVFILSILGVLLALFVFVVASKYIQGKKYRRSLVVRNSFEPGIQSLLTAPSLEPEYNLYLSRLQKLTKKPSDRDILEIILLEIIEQDQSPSAERARGLAYYLGFPKECVALIASKRSTKIALGCHKAGLYRYSEAIPDMQRTLDTFSSDIQIEVLMALSVIGDGPALEKAFDQIKHMVLINERTVIEIMDSFTGDKAEPYRRLISHAEPYIAGLFLKSIDDISARNLLPEILDILDTTKDKELYLSAIKALGRIGDTSLAPRIIEALSSTEWEIRAVSAKLLGTIVVPEAKEPLVKAVCDREWWVRQNASRSILSYPDHEELLRSALQSEDTYARDSILYTLESAGDAGLLERIKKLCLNIWPSD